MLEAFMRISAALLVLTLMASVAPTGAQEQKQSKILPNMLTAKSVYFEDQTGVAAVGSKALARLKKWGRFQVVQDRGTADLIILLSAEPYNGSNIIFAGGQTGSIDARGNITEDNIPNFNKLAPIRYAYLTVIDPKDGETLWKDSHRWGGLLTGFNSAGETLIKKLEGQYKK